MKQFISFLNTQAEIISLPVDGGECIHLTPDASGGDVGHGFTCTGLAFLKWNKGNPQFLVGNDGRNVEPGEPGSIATFYPSLVVVELDYTGDDNVPPASHTATKVDEIILDGVSSGTVQGVAIDNDGSYWYVNGYNCFNVENQYDGLGNAVLKSSFSLSGSNGLAYDDVNDNLLIKFNGDANIKRYSKDGVLLDDSVLTTIVDGDQISYRSDLDLFFVGSGSNDSNASLRTYRLSTGEELSQSSYVNCKASEGVSIVTHPSDGKTYVYYANDAYFHPATDPDLRINAIHKLNYAILT